MPNDVVADLRQTIAALERELAERTAERDEALDQQAATAEVLQVINSSPGDLAPVFDAMLDKAMRLCEAAFGILLIRDGSQFRTAALHGVPPALAEFLSRIPREPGKHTAVGRMLDGEDFVHFEDMTKEPAYQLGDPRQRAFVEQGGTRTYVAVALRKDGRLVGTIGAYRQEVRPFTDKQIALLQNFAAQAVIAMENARLLTETREALEQQTATAEVLQVINSSPGDLTPVFDAMLEKALRLCEAAYGHIWRIEGEYADAVALRGGAQFIEAMRQEGGRAELASERPLGRLARGEHMVHMPDATKEAVYRTNPAFREFIDASEIRTGVMVALRKDEALLGAIVVHRKEVLPFTDKQIALLRNFAAQAVIAMENARLITETREALEQQTATAEVLQVINSSPGALAPVFDAMLGKAMQLCGAAFGILWTYEGECIHAAALYGVPSAAAEFFTRGPHPVGAHNARSRLMRGERIVHVADVADTDLYRSGDPLRRTLVDICGGRTLLVVPLRKDDAFLGDITIFRQEVRPFSDKQIALLENFAAQAVIAMENARLITETREALEQQTATAEVLQVINSSPGDLAPVFESILDKAHSLCGATVGSLQLFEDGYVRTAATHGFPESHIALLRQPFLADRGGHRKLMDGERILHIADWRAYAKDADHDIARSLLDNTGVRTCLAVPLRNDATVLGCITAWRLEVRPFSEKEIVLLENFAAQAVIAIENARLLGELRERTGDLQESLEYQTATSDVLKVISRSTFDLQPVLDTLVETAARLCNAEMGLSFRREGELYRLAANYGFPPEYEAYWQALGAIPYDPDSSLVGWRCIGEARPVHIHDAAAVPGYPEVVANQGKARTALGVPLLREGEVIGNIVLARQRVESFTDRQIELVRTFADQAVIAMENARLLGELQQRTDDLQESLEYQTATSDVLKVISRSTFDLQPVLDTLIQAAARLCNGPIAGLAVREGDGYRYAATTGMTPELDAVVRGRVFVPGRDGVVPRTLLERRVVHIIDAQVDPEYNFAEVVSLGIRTLLGVPMLREDEVIGVITVTRDRVEPFTERQIELVQTFADQAVIALENARLLGELQQRTDELAARNSEYGERIEHQSATIDVLKAMSASPGDPQPVFDLIVRRARDLCNTAAAGLFEFDGELVHFRSIVRDGSYGTPDAVEAYERLYPMVPTRGSITCRAILDRQTIHVRDMATVSGVSAAVRNLGVESQISLPLLRDGAAIGAVVLTSAAIGGFTDSQVALLQTFAEQAVIAITSAETYRQLQQRTADLQESLEYQTAASDVLKVISRSTFDIQPVFETIVETAARLCGADTATIRSREGEAFRAAATFAASSEYAAFQRGRLLTASRGTVTGRTAIEGQVIHIHDIASDAEYTLPEAVTLGQLRTALGVPLLREGVVVGVISLQRQRVQPFTDRQIELVRTFADQAVIALENARLLGELQQRTGDLQESLEYQTATSDVLKVISRSTFDLDAALRTVVTAAARLCRADHAGVYRNEGGEYRWAAGYNQSPQYEQVERAVRIFPGPGTLVGRTADHCGPVQILDAEADPLYEAKEDARIGNIHSMLGVPLLREGSPIGVIGLARTRIEPFTEKQVELVSTFADQSVIAIENARLLNELRDRTDELTRSVAELQALEEVLRAVNSSLDLDTVLATIISRAALLSQADEGTIYEFDETEEVFVPKSAFGMSAERVAALRERRVRLGETHLGRAAVERAPVHVHDVQQDATLGPDRGVLLEGIHAVLAVPLLREDKVVGGLVIRRRAAGGFAPTIPTLLQTFAGQAVLAIENARLFQELMARGEEARRARTAAEAALADLRRAQDRLIQSEKMASLGQLTAGIAHEIKNPLNFVNNFAGLSVELLDELKETAAPAVAQLGDDTRAEIDEIVGMLSGNLEKIAEHGRRADGIVKSMLEHSRGVSGERREVDLNALVDEALNLAYHGARAQDASFNITLERDLDRSTALIELVPQDVTRVLLNLFGNGFYAANKRNEANDRDFKPSLKVTTRDLGEAVEVRVRDNGTGIAPELRDKLFQPFFTTKPTGEGTGLGLSISWDIVTQQHGGTIEVDSRAGEFTEFTIRLPRSRHVATTQKAT